ncbi:MAG: glycosyltransferase family 2 protein [Candidatus Paceibacterota bacterium]|jgi:GT2 family glycosyltransferase
MKEYPIITISIINFNDHKFIFKAIESAVSLDYPNLDIIITDNNSTDGTREEIGNRLIGWKEERKKIAEKYLHINAVNEIRYIKNDGNFGFGRPHNEAIRQAKGEFILPLNSDAILSPDYLLNALGSFSDDRVGAVQGKLLRYDFDKNELYKSKSDKSLNVIDTTGLMMLKNRRIVCIGQGEADQGQFEEKKEIFGVDGAVPVYRMKALEDVKMTILSPKSIMSKVHKVENPESNNKLQATCLPPACRQGRDRQASYKLSGYEFFDEDFFMYKEDVDLSWRLRLYGWKAVYDPRAVAYHGRGSGDSMATNYISIIRERRKINARAKFLSFKHQRLMQIKCDMPGLLFTKHFPDFIIKEIGAWAYMAIFERFTLRVLKDLYRDVPKFIKKRKMVMKGKRSGAAEMERWFMQIKS